MPDEEMIINDNLEIFKKNGFDFAMDKDSENITANTSTSTDNINNNNGEDNDSSENNDIDIPSSMERHKLKLVAFPFSKATTFGINGNSIPYNLVLPFPSPFYSLHG